MHPARLGTLRSRTSAAYKGINTLIQREGSQDFFWKSTIRDLDESDWEEHRLDIHHIFPKSWCDKQGIPASRYNSILNKTPISFKPTFRRLVKKEDNIFDKERQKTEESIAFHGLSWQFA
ncbi:hypothetical protein [Nostoc sp. ATCC 53789]|uniref:hypothetical protein n=1 Tax=Nostoc sp. ATCC 53789 TaxID=76335 RepID=UPI000DFF641F|nr:hypothetical protein [Nostoc sp. ATCC 53789]QHG14977.1 hypothetical protein GJB62_02560 [Nostoc sp. ATCC 53789]RCJ17840.1 hypothetical protein A6V25_28610 [Nostoc sp. ATCC 53789]